MIEKVEMYSVVCDRCKTLFEDSYTGCIAWVDEETAKERAESDKWMEFDNKYYCPCCYEYDWDTDEYKVKR